MNRRITDEQADDLYRAAREGRLGEAVEHLLAARETKTSTARLYLAPDSYGDPTIWRDTGHDRDEAVLTRTGGNAAGFDALAGALERVAEVEREHRDLVSRLGFGDNITEPMAESDTIVEWFEQQSRDANEWQESQLWRNDCYAAGHPDDEDCFECDPSLRLERAEAKIARVEALAATWEADSLGTDRYCAADLRTALTGGATR